MDSRKEEDTDVDEEGNWSEDSGECAEDLETIKTKLFEYAGECDDQDIRSVLLKFACTQNSPRKETEDEDYVILYEFLQRYLFQDSYIEIEEVEIPEPDLESYLEEDTEDEEKSERHLYDGKIVWECENYHVEVRPDARSINYGLELFRIRVSHEPYRQVQNSGHLYDLNSVEELCSLLKKDDFEHAMAVLFYTYGGGPKNRQKRSNEDLEAVVSESWVRSTISGQEP